MRLIQSTAEDIEAAAPDLVVTIDAPAFNMRVVKRLRERGYEGKIVHYVAPSVWAYNPERVQKVAKLYDHVLALLPFEPPYFAQASVGCTFVGHPVVEDKFRGKDVTFRTKHKIPPDVPLLAVMPGSRNGEIKRLMPVFIEAVKVLSQQVRKLHVVVLATDRLAHKVQDYCNAWKHIPNVIITDKQEKMHALAASNAALVKSGTGSLEVAMSGTPFVIAYKVHPLSAYILKKKIKVKYVNIINLVMDEPVIPELLQGACEPLELAVQLEKLMISPKVREKQQDKCKEALKRLGLGTKPTPSQKAANALLGLLGIKTVAAVVEEEAVEFSFDDHATEDLMNVSAANQIVLPDAQPTKKKN
ncbi:MAG: lipid-A-disaccharide synthase [Proteobacteria bacterium]|nr:lipid-A-disaccharide synthase [Pseudomonadota bacterium]